jgi:hypothetical protein
MVWAIMGHWALAFAGHGLDTPDLSGFAYTLLRIGTGGYDTPSIKIHDVI